MRKILLSAFLFIIVGCGDKFSVGEKVYSIIAKNNSSKIISIFYKSNYPDTSLPSAEPILGGILPNGSRFLDSKKKWETVFAESPRDTLSFFYLSVDTLSAYPWSVIQSQYKILKRYDLSLQDLQNRNWTITYP
jgi:hypothetical protein